MRQRLATIGVSIVALSGAAFGQITPDSLLQQQRVIDDKLATDRLDLAPVESILDWQWGGWLEYYYFNFDDGIQGSRQVQRPAISLWTRLSIDNGAHEIFARTRLRYTEFEFGDEIDRRQDWDGPDFDRVWYQIDFRKAFGGDSDDGNPNNLIIRAGRQPVIFGTGYAFDRPIDAVTLHGRLDDLRIMGVFGKSIPSFPNIDRSDAVDTHSHRHFYGVQLSYAGLARHEPFVYALWNNDKTDERPKDLFQNYSYDTFYFGAGSRGEIARNLNYWVEGVWESGRSFGDGMFLRRNVVEAYGWDAGVEYLWDAPTRPRAAFEYMFASGDGNRRFSPTNAAGGNRGDRHDSSFNAFGFRNTGLALAPALSNIHILKLSGSCVPFAEHELFKDFEVGADFFVYHKNQSGGAISDFTADRRNGYVGWEMDYYLNWRFASDLSWTFRWGTFFPGSAYTDDDSRHFLFTGLTWSF